MNCPLCSSPRREPWATLPEGGYWLCAICKLIWLDERFLLGEEEEHARYRAHQNSAEDARYLAYLGRTALPVARLVPRGARGLDFGCGPAEGVKALLSPLQFSVDSYDPLFYPREDLLNFRYDFLICCEAAEHFRSPAHEFALFARLLAGGGVLGVSSALAVPRAEFAHWHYRRDPTHVVFYQEETVQWIARKGGWEILELDSPLWILRKL